MKKLYQDSTFYLVVFIVSYFIYIYPFEILNDFLFNEKPNRRSSLLYSLFISILVIFYFRSKNTFLPLKFFIYEGMGIGFISFWIINISLIVNYFKIIDKYTLGVLSLFLIIIISLVGILYGRLIFTKKIKILSNKIKKQSNIIFISDVHLGTNTISHLQKILDKIKNLKYDFILIGGDLIDSSSFDLSKLSIFKQISKPIYFVTGNHEYYIENHREKLNKLNQFGIIILDNENIHINDINLTGINDKQTSKEQVNKYLKLKDEQQYNLLLVHKPSIWNQVKGKVDLMLSGHCHNGQIIPFNLFVKLQFKYIYGFYTYNNSNLYISSGSACWGPRLRVGTFNEIVHIEITPN